MKKSRLLFKVMLLAVVAMISVSFASCGGNDDEAKSVKQKLVGVWKTTMYGPYWKLIELKSDGTMYYDLKVDEIGAIDYEKSKPAKWIYDETDKEITMYTESGHENYIYTVDMADDGNSWSGIHVNSGSQPLDTFTRVLLE